MKGFYAKRLLCLTLLFLLSAPVTIFSQLSKDDIREILIIQGFSQGDNLENRTNHLYDAYIESISYKTTDEIDASVKSISSGIFMGFHQSSSARYPNTGWLPPFMSTWYKESFSSDIVLAKSFTSHKVFRELDYIADRSAYYKWNRFFGNNWYLALPMHWLLKNISGELIRHRMKYGTFY